MSEEYYQLNLGKYFKAIWRQKWLVILCLCSSIVLAVLIVKSQMPLYEARVSFWIREREGEREIVSERLMQLFFIGRQEPFETTYGTQIAIMKSPLILQEVVKNLGLPYETPKQLRHSVALVRKSISISKIESTTIIEVKAIHPSPEMTVKIAQAVYEVYTEFSKKLYLEEEQRMLKSMEEQVRLIREEMGKSNDLITEKTKGDMYLLLIGKIAETRLNLSLGQVERVKVINKDEEAGPIPSRWTLIVFLMGLAGLFFGTVSAVAIDVVKKRKKVV